jgi:hypothetical protein
VVWTCGTIGQALLLGVHGLLTCSAIGRTGAFDRSVGRIGARNAKVTKTVCKGLERVYDVGALVCAGRMQRVSVSAEQF